MKTIIQLLIVALILHAVFQTARAYYTFYDYRDTVLEEAHHGRVAKMSELHQRVIDVGKQQYGLDVKWEDVRVSLQTGQVVVDFAYVEPVPLIPKYYVKPWAFSGTVSAFRPRPLIEDER